MDGKAQFAAQALPLLQAMQPSLLQQMMIERVCDMTGLSLDQLSSVVALQANVIGQTAESLPKSTSFSNNEPQSYTNDYDRAPFLGSPARSVPKTRRARLDLIDSAISILLHRPELARVTFSAEELTGLQGQNLELLQQLLRYFQASEEHSLGTLLFDWQQDPLLAPSLLIINEISHLDPLLESVDAEKLLGDAMNRILTRKREADLQRLKQLSRERPLSEEEKQRLQQLLSRTTLGN